VSEGRPALAAPTTSERVAVATVLLVAAAFRFVALDRDFRFAGPSFDELHNFIQPVHWMWQRGTADPHVYSGYPGFFNYLIFAPVTLARELVGLEAAYVAARAVVAAFGLLNVWLIYVLGRSLFGPLPALVGATLMACSRAGVREAHQISPDVLVATALLLMLLFQRRRGGSPRDDLTAGALLGLATAIKYTGLLLAPALLASLAARGRLRGLVPALAAAALAFTLAAPYAVFQRDQERGSGLLASLEHYFAPEVAGAGDTPPPERLGLRALLPMLQYDAGPLALLVAVASLLLWRPAAHIAASAAVVVCSVAAMALATMTFPRHALVPLAAGTVLAMAGLAGLQARLPARGARLAMALAAVLVLAAPVARSSRLFARQLQPSGAQLAQAWLAANLAAPARVATSLYGMPLPRDRFEVRSQLVLADLPLSFLAHFDAVVARDGELAFPVSWTEAARFETGETPAALLVVRPAARPPRRLAPLPTAFDASVRPGDAARTFDGDPATAWGAGPGRGWVEARWDAPIPIERVEVDAGDDRQGPQRWWLLGGESGELERLEAPRLRPRFGQIHGLAPGQVFVLTPPRPLAALRLVRQQGEQWSVAEIRVYLAEPVPNLAGAGSEARHSGPGGRGR
jgi:4-amino-4-deoxy-L-arabinose transferase-like glycosyltransferase